MSVPIPNAPRRAFQLGCKVRFVDPADYCYGKIGTLVGVDGYGHAHVRMMGADDLIVNLNDIEPIARQPAAPSTAAPIQHSSTTPPAQPVLKKDEFSERGVLPSDVPGINEMVKRMFKEKRDETKPEPVRPTSHAGLLITASERYLGLGYNDEIYRDVQHEVVNAKVGRP